MLLSLAAALATPSLIPLPNHVEWREGAFEVVPTTKIARVGASENAERQFRLLLGPSTGFRFERSRNDPRSVVLRISGEGSPESYRLVVAPDGVEITSPGEQGLFYGMQTFRQLLGPDASARTQQAGPWRAPSCVIEDSPRFGWRGLMLDESRHFFGEDFVKEFIDDLAAHKMNSFHWHLTDDGGWRLEIRQFPELTRVGAWRRKQGVVWDYGNLWFPGPQSGESLYGGFYTQEQARRMVQYAADRHVNIVPEIEMPGHSTAAVSAYPSLACEPPAEVMQAYLKAIGSQAPSMVCPGKNATVEFFKKVLDETMEIFPSKYIHIGGDEVDKTLWRQCKFCQERMRAEGLKDVDELQSWFVRQMDAYLESKGRHLLGWDEILEGGLAPGATVMSWRGIAGGIAAAKSGHDVVMSPTSHCYFDYPYETIPTEKVYSFEPVPAELTAEEGRHILGAQGNLWTEWLQAPQDVLPMTYPRAAALAEAIWTAPERKSWPDFQRRLSSHYRRMAAMGIRFRMDAPVLEPSLLNLEAASEWQVSPSAMDGAHVVFLEGSAQPTAPGEARVVYEWNGTRSGGTVGTVARLSRVEPGQQPGLERWVRPWTGAQAPKPSEFSGEPTVVSRLDAVGLEPSTNVAALFRGTFQVPKDGRYEFFLTSDDGSLFLIDGHVVVNNDGFHTRMEKRGSVDLQEGAYKFEVIFFNGTGPGSVALEWRAPGGRREELASFRH